MVKGFYYRLAVLFLVMAGVSFLIAFVAILPSYFFSSSRYKIVNTKLEIQKKEPVPLPEERTLAIIKDLNNKLGLIENIGDDKFIVSQKVVSAVILKKIPGIRITDISYENETENNSLQGKKISIRGTAPSREVLLSFRQALEDSPAFKQVDLPISNFIKGSNIKFYLSLIPS